MHQRKGKIQDERRLINILKCSTKESLDGKIKKELGGVCSYGYRSKAETIKMTQTLAWKDKAAAVAAAAAVRLIYNRGYTRWRDLVPLTGGRRK